MEKKREFYLANSNTFKGDYIIPTVEDIIIESNHIIKQDCFIKITAWKQLLILRNKSE